MKSKVFFPVDNPGLDRHAANHPHCELADVADHDRGFRTGTTGFHAANSTAWQRARYYMKMQFGTTSLGSGPSHASSRSGLFRELVCGGGAGVDVQFLINRTHVFAHGVDGDRKFPGNLLVGQSVGEMLQDLLLPFG